MALQYVKDDEGRLKVDEQTGHPLVYDSEKDPEVKNPFPLDGQSLYSKIPSLNEEAKKHRLKAKEFEEKLKAYEGLDPEKAREALDKLKALEAGDLKKAEEVEKLKKEISTAYEAKMADIKKAYESKVSELSQNLSEKEQRLYDLAITDVFARSKYFSGENALSWMTPDIAKAYLGPYFHYEDGKVVGYWGENRIMSQSDPTRVADPDEALDIIIQRHPRKDNILKPIPGGSGAHRNVGPPGKNTMPRKTFESMSPDAQMAFIKKGGIPYD